MEPKLEAGELARARISDLEVGYSARNAREWDQLMEALDAYETFLAHADARTNQLEIEKVNLRLPSLRKQIKLGQGAKSDRKVQ